jgi:hypothetical protein
MKNKEQQDHYLKHGHLINKKIQCNQCKTDVTMFGSNLANRITKFGTLWSLLDEFKCRKCVSAAKPMKAPKIKKVSVKKEKQEEIKSYVVPKMQFSIPRNVFLKDAPDIIEAYTAFSCGAPALYLNNGRKCTGCALFQSCGCALKKAA